MVLMSSPVAGGALTGPYGAARPGRYGLCTSLQTRGSPAKDASAGRFSGPAEALQGGTVDSDDAG